METYVIGKIKEDILKVVKELGLQIAVEEIKIEHPGEAKNGDYSKNMAMLVE